MTQEMLSNTGLIDAQDLYYLLSGATPVKILDATYALPGGALSPHEAYLQRHIEGAQFFDIDAVADPDAPLPHTLPDADFFEEAVAAMGISSTDHVVIYDQSGSYMASSRAWWMFRVFGHEYVYVLNGGLERWVAAGFATKTGPELEPAPGTFKAALNPTLVVDKAALLANLEDPVFTVVDARPEARFEGTMPEPRPAMRAGHIPGSRNVPFVNMLEGRGRLIKQPAAVEQTFHQAGLLSSDKIAVTCGSGVTACTLALALYQTGNKDVAVYDGSWSEWGLEESNTPIEFSA